MKTLLNVAVVTCIALATSSSAFAKTKKPKTTLADFKGTYSGTASLVVSGTALAGPVSLTFTAPKSGKSATIKVGGSVAFSGTTLPVVATIALSKGSFTIDNFLFNSLAPGSLPGFASYSVAKNVITFQGAATISGTAYPFSGTISTKTKGRTQTLTFVTVDLLGGIPYVFTFTVTRHLKKSEVED